MNTKFNFLNFLVKNGFKLAEPNEEEYTHLFDNGDYNIAFKYEPNNKCQFSSSIKYLIISYENPKDEKKAKEILDYVLNFYKS